MVSISMAASKPVLRVLPAQGGPRSHSPRTAKINAYYVCGPKGTFTPPDNFGCVTAIQTFPGDASVGYEPNRPFLPHGGD
jgi:hypothetical protein